MGLEEDKILTYALSHIWFLSNCYWKYISRRSF